MVAKTECKEGKSYLGAKTLEETMTGSSRPNPYPHLIHTAWTMPNIRVTILVSVNPAIGTAPNELDA